MLDEMIKEMKCFNCVHAPVCSIQKGGVNLQLVDSAGCDYYQEKTPEDSVLISKEKLLEIAKDYTEMADLHDKIYKEKVQVYKQAVKDYMTKLENRLDEVDIILHEDSDEEYLYINGLLDLMDKVAEEMGVE